MSIKRSGLGRNLSALLTTSSHPINKEEDAPLTLPHHWLHPGKYQPRTLIVDDALEELAASIKKQGLLQPILIRKTDDMRYEIIAGERRWRASKIAGLVDIPVLVRQVDDETAMAMALVENLQREELTSLDQARAMARLSDEFSLTHQDIATLLSKSRASVTNFLRLLTLSADVLPLLENGHLNMGHAKVLLGLEGDEQIQLAKHAAAEQWSVREIEKRVHRLKNQAVAVHTRVKQQPALPLANKIQALTQHLKTDIVLKNGGAEKGKLQISYRSFEELNRIIEQMLVGG